MSDENFTKGEWWFDGYSYIWAKDKEQGHLMIADFSADETEGNYIARLRGCGRGARENGESVANALLISAAPNLLEACLFALGLVKEEESDSDLRNGWKVFKKLAEFAIEKATPSNEFANSFIEERDTPFLE